MENAMTGLMRLMKKYDIPLTRENYLKLAYLGEVPEPLSAEQEADLPVELQSSIDNAEARMDQRP
jgi:hypothetical protein